MIFYKSFVEMASIAHYNTLAKQQRDVEERDESPILR